LGGGLEVIARLKAWAALAGLVVVGLVASWFGGRKAANTDAKVKGLEDYADTRKRMDEVGRMSDADAARDWLVDRVRDKGK
jgi:hypothetical protein